MWLLLPGSARSASSEAEAVVAEAAEVAGAEETAAESGTRPGGPTARRGEAAAGTSAAEAVEVNIFAFIELFLVELCVSAVKCKLVLNIFQLEPIFNTIFFTSLCAGGGGWGDRGGDRGGALPTNNRWKEEPRDGGYSGGGGRDGGYGGGRGGGGERGGDRRGGGDRYSEDWTKPTARNERAEEELFNQSHGPSGINFDR